MDSFKETDPIYSLANKLVERKAAVLVGAGFSRNAIPISPDCQSEFPLLDDLAKEMQTRIKETFASDKGIEPVDGTSQILEISFLDIASLFEDRFGRPELDDFISSRIPDRDYAPDEAHERLLSFPWVDIYTTNYDTLIERANNNTTIGKYSLILESKDFKESESPRIIKLHGTLPKGPYIITNRDYATYEATHGLFSARLKFDLAGRVFCLLGFSGEDPNFKRFLRWVIDQLKDVRPQIYLISLSKIPDLQNLSSQSQGIIPIELSGDVDDARRRGERDPFRAVILKFLTKLQEMVDYIRLERTDSSFGNTQDGEKRIAISQAQLFVSSGKRHPDYPITTDALVNLLTLWRSERENYPGWLVAPRRFRRGLWEYTEHWIEAVLYNIGIIPPNQSLSLLYELDWRLETTACPLAPKWIPLIDEILRFFDTTSVTDDGSLPNNVSLDSSVTDVENELNSDYRFSLHLSLARAARTNQDLVRYSEEMAYLRRNLQGNSQRIQQLGYEQALGDLFAFDEDRVREHLRNDNWPLETERFPLFGLRRAAILAELGDVEEAEGLARRAITVLQSINGKIKPEKDISTHSQEAWGRLLLKALEQNRRQLEPSEDDRKRNAELEILGLNPTAECSELVSSLKSNPRPVSLHERRSIGFDPRHFAIQEGSLTFSSALEFSDLIPSYTMLKIFELAGLPYRCGMISLFNDGIIAATKYISQDSQYLSILSLLRTGNQDAIIARFSRMDVAVMPREIVDRLSSIISVSISQSQIHLREKENRISLFPSLFAQRLMAVFPEILSRLSFRLTPEDLQRAYSLGLELYQDPIIQNYYFFHETVGKLIPRTLFAMGPATVIQRLPALLRLPIPGANAPVPAIPSRWKDPFEDGEWLDGIPIEEVTDRKDLDQSIDYLLRIGDGEECGARQRAILRLFNLYENRYLADPQASEFGRVLWSRTDETGLPVNTGLSIHAFLDLPAPEEGVAKRVIKESLLKANFRRFIEYGIGENGKKTRTVHGVGGDPFPWDLVNVSYSPRRQFFAKTSNFIEWTDDELLGLFDKIITHWASLKNDLDLQKNDPMPFFGSQANTQLNGIVRVLGDLLIPAFLKMDRRDLAQTCNNILKEIADYDISIAPAFPSLLQLDADLLSEAEKIIHQGLISDADEEIGKSHIGLYNWLVLSADPEQRVPRPPQYLWDLISLELLFLRQSGLDSTIQLLGNCLEHRLGDFSEYHITTIVRALEKLKKEISLTEKTGPEEQCISGIRRNEIPYYRDLVGELSHILYEYLEERKAGIPEILFEYKKEGEVDVLPEVRKNWRVKIIQPTPPNA